MPTFGAACSFCGRGERECVREAERVERNCQRGGVSQMQGVGAGGGRQDRQRGGVGEGER